MAKAVVVNMDLARDTKNTYRFEEPEGGDGFIGTLYIQKRAFPEGAPPKIVVTFNND
jgi:hypothetical protein